MDGTVIHSAADLQAQNERVAAIFGQRRDRLLAFVRRQIGDALEAEEIVQDVFTELIAASRLLRPIEHVSAWLARVTRNRLIDRFRKRKRQEGIAVGLATLADTKNAGESPEPEALLDSLQLPDSEGPERLYHRDVALEAIDAALAQLSSEQREAFIEHELEGLTIREIAQKQGVSVNTLLGRKRAAVLHLRSHLRAIYDELPE
jgi:RNA polymerase sigma factor (sigma-70 family)